MQRVGKTYVKFYNPRNYRYLLTSFLIGAGENTRQSTTMNTSKK